MRPFFHPLACSASSLPLLYLHCEFWVLLHCHPIGAFSSKEFNRKFSDTARTFFLQNTKSPVDDHVTVYALRLLLSSKEFFYTSDFNHVEIQLKISVLSQFKSLVDRSVKKYNCKVASLPLQINYLLQIS